MAFYIPLMLACIGLCYLDRFLVLPNITIIGSSREKHIKYSFSFFNLACFVLLFFAFVRIPVLEFGGDSYHYHAFFSQAAQTGLYPSYEIGYITLMRLFLLFSNNYQLFIAICSLLTLVPILYTIYYEVNDFHWIAIFLFIATQYFQTFGILRQYLAVSFIFLAYKNYRVSGVKHWFYFIVSVLFHNAAFIIILLLCLSKIKYKPHYYIVIGAGSFLVKITAVSQTVNILLSHINGRYDAYTDIISGNESAVFIVCFLLLTVLSALYYEKLLEQNPKNLILINFSFFMLVFNLCYTWVPAYSRIVTAILAFMCILVPNILNCEKDRRIRIVLTSILLCFFMVYMYLNTGFKYDFFF